MTAADIAREVAKALAARPQQDGITAREYAEARKVEVKRGRDELRLLMSLGRLRYAGKAPRMAMNGEMRPVPIYTLVKGKEK